MAIADGDGTLENKDDVSDGGWGWLVVLAVFVGNLLIDGVIGCFGLLYPEILEEFGANPAVTSLAGSILVGIYLFSSLLWGGCVRIYGCRIVCFTGGCICALGFGFSIFSQNILAFILTYSVLGGIGFGMNSMSGHVIINSYFNKRRGIAQGIVSSGAGAGVFLLAPLKQYTLVEYGWRGTMLIFAGIMLHFCVCACLMRPYSTNDTSACSSVEDSEISDNSEIEVKTSHGENIFKDNKNLLAPLLKDNVDSNLKLGFSKSVNGFLTPEMNVKYKRNRTVSEYVPNEVPDDLIYISSLPNLSKSHIRKENKRSSKLCSQDFDLFKRKDILHSGSLYNLKEFRESVSTKSFIESMMLRDENANERNICDKSATDITCCASLKVLREHLCDFTVFRNKVFIPILIGAIFIQMSQFIPNTFIAEYGYSIHLDEGEISAIMSLYGVSNIFGRLSAGCFANIQYTNPLWLCNFGTVMCGIACVLFPLCNSFASLCSFAVGQGYFIGYFAPLQILILVKYFGLDKLTSSVGFLQMAKGPAAVLGPPLAGLVFDVTNSYGTAIQFAGALSLTAAAIQSVTAVLDRCTEERVENHTRANGFDIVIHGNETEIPGTRDSDSLCSVE